MWSCVLAHAGKAAVGRKPESKGNMPIIEIESAWRETGIVCPFCEGEWMTYSNGETRPQCGNDNCLRVMPDEYIFEWLITLPEFRPTLRAADKWRAAVFLSEVITATRN